MKAVTLDGFDTPPRLRDDLPAPTPAAHGVLVRVHASSINPSDNSIATGMLKQMGVEYEFPVILGRDYAGVVSLAVQLAARAGATVVAPALAEDEAYLRELGLSELLPRDGDLAAAVRDQHPDGFDAVLDLVNYAPDVPASLVKDGGRVASPTGAAGEGPGRTLVMAAPTPENLERLARL